MDLLAKFIPIIGLMVFFEPISAQTSVSSAGGDAAGPGGSASYSVGQILYTFDNGTAGSVAKGVQQAYEISIVTGFASSEEIMLTGIVYPNPVSDFFILKIENYEPANLTFKLLDINGKLIETGRIRDKELQINMEDRLPGIYLLKIFDRQKEIKIFKIIKK